MKKLLFILSVLIPIQLFAGTNCLSDTIKISIVDNEISIEADNLQELEEMIKPVLMFNKLDRLIMELQLTGEEIYQRLNSHLKEVNDFISDNNTKMPKILLNPSVGNVTFG